ncbi:MarR family winged helix-turn-helix transcriptional regulator [Aureimonas sp. SK2]|uniref:MarR family winged helix-turn-helix transcriptional regulator n=1 Tax=Aureimonas sp. SK2 TaxID=3015992 RepID=UPI002443ECDD|nr:MarR family winged helix-turn-helix transcriptional regulator [Aureimonas sp. SK2]
MSQTLVSSDAALASSSSAPAGEGGMVQHLLSISKSTRAFLSLLLMEIDLHPGQDQLLARVEPGVPISVSALADQLSVRPSTVSKMLDRLMEKNLVERTAHSHDARRTMVMLTPAGEALRGRVNALWEKLEGDLNSAVAPERRGDLLEALREADSLLAAKLRRLR